MLSGILEGGVTQAAYSSRPAMNDGVEVGSGTAAILERASSGYERRGHSGSLWGYSSMQEASGCNEDCSIAFLIFALVQWRCLLFPGRLGAYAGNGTPRHLAGRDYCRLRIEANTAAN